MTMYRPAASFTTDARYGRVSSVQSLFRRARKLEENYRTQLRKIARHIGDIARAHDAESPDGIRRIQSGMMSYAQRIDPWADSVADRMIKEIAAADKDSWRRTSHLIGRLLHKEIETAPSGIVMQQSLQRQVGLIKSLPIEAAERVHKLTTEASTTGRRTAEIVKDIMASGDVARSRADLIARTEVSRTATELTQARATHVGSTHFIWNCVLDGSTRASHRALNGHTFRWDQPPECDPGYHALPGAIWNCRCFPTPIIDEES
ncbi:phage minor head protein [Beijerinckia sp. L45]|uniref:phage head morphogenesis protein n=1 Tax=Beijerinckia sp. L45 TaxID=1641855 RepID=UPI00131D743C|nr:phage minor head protein [Beijerinckia sp. L45]